MANQRNGALGGLVGYHLRRAYSLFAQDFSAAMAGTGMRQVLVGILAVVAHAPGSNQVSVGRALGIKRANMVPLITELADAGLIARSVDASDRRAFALSLTDKGQAVLDTCLARIAAHEDHMLAGFTTAERATLIGLLARIVSAE